MTRRVSIGVCSLAALVLAATLAPAAQGANTWEGVWNSDFGRMTLSASGAGTYEGFSPGTVSGPAVGDVNEGTWNQPGDPPRSGTYRFVLSPGGQSFTGAWEYDPPGSGCGTACGWNGTCIEGPCLQNSVGSGGGGSCRALPGPAGLFAAIRADSCRPDVKFSFRTSDGLPDKPGDKDLPKSLLALEAKGSGRMDFDPSANAYFPSGDVSLTTTHTLAFDERKIQLRIEPLERGSYRKNGDLRRVDFGGRLSSSTDQNCADDGIVSFEGALAVKRERANLRLIFSDRCLSRKPIVWKTKNIEKASIKVVK